MLSDKEIIEGIASNNSKVLNYVYDEFFPYVESYVRHHGGTTDQSKDLFQEGMIIVFRKIVDGKFSLHCKFGTYLYAVCKRIWIQERKKKIEQIKKETELVILAEPEQEYGKENLEKARRLLDKHLKKISADCQKVLHLYFNDIKIDEIRKIMGLETVHKAVDKKYRCKKNLINRIVNDPLFSKLKK